MACLIPMLFGCDKPSPKRQDAETHPAPAQASGSESNARSEPPPGPTESKPTPAPASPPARSPGEAPGPDKLCGHAIAFAGWKANAEGEADRLSFFDPGDNELDGGKTTHQWKARPAEAPVFLGRLRPTIVLEPAGAFTVCGAVVIRASRNTQADKAMRNYSENIPDLSQHLGNGLTGLCGPTSAADLIFGFSTRRPAIQAGLSRGPSAEANRQASRLIAGVDGEVDHDSLAGRMGLRPGQDGVTNDGIQRGLKSWLDEHDRDAWEVELSWLDDEQKTPEQQTTFFRTLESAGRSGGGAILCLWPGAEFADASAQEANGSVGAGGTAGSSQSRGGAAGKSNRSVAGSTAGNQGDPVSQGEAGGQAETGKTLPGGEQGEDTSANSASRKGFRGRKPDQKAIESAITKANAEIAQAERSAAQGDVSSALESLGEAISALRPHARSDPRCRAALSKAKALAVSLNGAAPQGSASPNLPTSFE
jgi:hypothetical protein